MNYTLRQDSGLDNSLGQVRIDMPNRFAVYMHDTPAKSLFARSVRFHSHGCVRVGQVKELVGWLLQGSRAERGGLDLGADGDRDRHRRRGAAGHQAAEARAGRLRLLTGYAGPDGRAHFRDDIYGLDSPRPASVPAPAAARPADPPATVPWP